MTKRIEAFEFDFDDFGRVEVRFAGAASAGCEVHVGERGGARRFGAHWTPSDPYAESVIAIGEKNFVWTELARAVLSIGPIFGADMARPLLIEGIAGCLRGLLGGDPRGYLREPLNDE